MEMPFCPNCKAEYREGFTKCSDCDTELVKKLPSVVNSNLDNYKKNGKRTLNLNYAVLGMIIGVFLLIVIKLTTHEKNSVKIIYNSGVTQFTETKNIESYKNAMNHQPVNSDTIPNDNANIPDSQSQTGAIENSQTNVEHPEIYSIKTKWVTTSRGLTDAEGLIWVPQVSLNLKNENTNDIEIYIKAIFLDEKNIINGNDIIKHESITGTYSKGPIFFNGTVGYVSDEIFFVMAKDESKKWKVDLFVSKDYSGPYEKINSLTVNLPDFYEQIK